jgi:hypothetical protein
MENLSELNLTKVKEYGYEDTICYVECSCKSPDHVARFSFTVDENGKMDDFLCGEYDSGLNITLQITKKAHFSNRLLDIFWFICRRYDKCTYLSENINKDKLKYKLKYIYRYLFDFSHESNWSTVIVTKDDLLKLETLISKLKSHHNLNK